MGSPRAPTSSVLPTPAPPALQVRPSIWSPNSRVLTNRLGNKKTKLVRKELIRTC